MRRRARSTAWARVSSWVARADPSRNRGDQVFQWTSSPASQSAAQASEKCARARKTVADRAGAQPLVEAGEGVLGFGDRDEEFWPQRRAAASLGCFASR